MSKVHTFNLLSAIDGAMRMPLQFVGPGNYQARAIELSLLLEWIEANITLPTSQVVTLTTSGSIAVPAGKWALWAALESATAQTAVDVGETAGGSELGENVSLSAGIPARVQLGVFGGSGGTNVYFSGLTASTVITVLIV